MTATVETFPFQAETRQLLDIMIHSLYSQKEIFLRELISNASDAVDKVRFEAITQPELLAGGEQLEIRLEPDKEARTLTIHDTGIGMSRAEVIAHIGTIAKSGTREMMARLRESKADDKVENLIGQFGVGFYSSFMVADKVTLVTRRAGEQTATYWESTGQGEYAIADAERPTRGTSITLHLKPVDTENGIEDFTDPWVIKRIVKRYSDFVRYPILLKEEHQDVERDADGKPTGQTKTIVEDKTLNSMKPIWTLPTADVTEAEYTEFYQQISHDFQPPLANLPLKAEGRIEYQALLFVPAHAPFDFYYVGAKTGLQLYVRRIMVMDHCEELLPRYLRFVKGVVDSMDLPLSISREKMQQDRHISQMRRWLASRVLEKLDAMLLAERDKYVTFWQAFGPAIKEGIASDRENTDKLIALALFSTSDDPEKLTTLAEYVGRMKSGQEEIYYLTGESRAAVEHSPHLEAFREKGYEVLYLIDPIDELMAQSLTEFEGKKLHSIAKGTVELGTADEKQQAEQQLKEQQQAYASLFELLQKQLADQVKEVRLSSRLTTSPVCLVSDADDYSPQLERLLKRAMNEDLPKQLRIMELNPKHPILEKMHTRFENTPDDPLLKEYAELLLGYALLAEGSPLVDPVEFNKQLADLMLRAL